MLVAGRARGGRGARSERNQGRAPNMKFMDHDRLGFNYRLTDVQAALGIAQLERLDELLAGRAAVAAAYSERLAALGAAEPGAGDPDDLVLPLGDRGGERRSWFVYVVRLPARSRPRRRDRRARPARDRRPALSALHPPLRPLPGALRDDRRASSRSPRTSRAARWRCRSTRPWPRRSIERVVAELADVLGRRPA